MGARCFVPVIMLSALAVGCGGKDSPGSVTAPSPVSVVRIAGRVVDERSAQGLPGVTLHWGGGRVGLLQITSVTDAVGSYQVELPDAEYYSVSADSVLPMSIVRPTGALDIVNFYVNTGGCPTWYGRVVNANSRRAVSGAEVSWAGVASTTDVTGNYRLSLECRSGGYGSGPTSLSANHPNYLSYSMPARSGDTLGITPEAVRFDIALTPR